MRFDEMFFLGLAAALWILTGTSGAAHLHLGSLFLPLWLPFAINATIASVAAIALYPRLGLFGRPDGEGEELVSVPRAEWEELRSRDPAVAPSNDGPKARPRTLDAWDEPDPVSPAPPKLPAPAMAAAPPRGAVSRPTMPQSLDSVRPTPPPVSGPIPESRPSVAARVVAPPTVATPPPPTGAPSGGSTRPLPGPARTPVRATPVATPDAAAQDVDEIIRLLESTLARPTAVEPPRAPSIPRGTKGVCLHCGEKIRPESAAVLRCSGCGGGLCVDGLAESAQAGQRGFCPACRALAGKGPAI